MVHLFMMLLEVSSKLNSLYKAEFSSLDLQVQVRKKIYNEFGTSMYEIDLRV